MQVRRWISAMLALLAVTWTGLVHASPSPQASCEVASAGDYSVARVSLWNGDAHARDYGVRVELRAGARTWRSQPLVGSLTPGQRVVRELRPFEAGVTIESCSLVGSNAPGATAVTTGPPAPEPDASELTHGVRGYLVGFGFALAGGVGLGLLGSRLDCHDCDEYDSDPIFTVLGAATGYALGFSFGFALGASHDHARHSYLATVAGGVIGGFAGLAAVVSNASDESRIGVAVFMPQLCAMAGYYLTHRHDAGSSPPVGALLELRDHELVVGVPAARYERRDGVERATLTLLGGRF